MGALPWCGKARREFLSESPTSGHHCPVASNQREIVVTWWPGWDYLIESAKGWADSFIADSYILFGRAGSYIWFIWFGIGCLVLLLVFEIIERTARRKK